MSDRVRVKMEATFLLRTYMPDWRDSADLDVAIRLMGALFEEADVSFEGSCWFCGDLECPSSWPRCFQVRFGFRPDTAVRLWLK